MSDTSAQSLDHLSTHGYAMLDGIFDVDEMGSFADRLSTALHAGSESSILRSRGRTYGSRNLLETFPEAADLLRRPSLKEFTTAVLGQDAGIVRVLYFDKPPDRSWSLPWHKDRTIAVKRNDLPSEHFRKPTVKAGVPHVEAPASLLDKMLTLRIHLDAMNGSNGPLCIIPGSHRDDNQEQHPPVELHANIGDVLAMRPLLSHSSIMSRPGISSHRRVIHIEISQHVELADGYEWHSFVPLDID
ncbi:MAG: phytanoyl-CoA dioxygenase family protein [Betaproteobacteria bacterium]